MQLHDATDLRSALDRLTDVLVRYEPLWRPRPFAVRPAPWEHREPELATWLRSLPERVVDALEADAHAHPVHPRYAALRDEVEAAAAVGVPFTADAVAVPREATWRMPGRKLDQSRALASVVEPVTPHAPRFVDWCGGKGHLSRLVALRTEGRATVVDRDAALLQAGDRLHRRAGLTSTWCEANVLRDPAPRLAELVADQDLALGLHSCGALTDALVEQVLATDTDVHASVPCCPHVVRSAAGYVPRSTAGRAVATGYDRAIDFDRIALRLAIADEVVARAADRRTRRREMAWRLGADTVLRAIGATAGYDSLGNVSTADFQRSFGEFCAWAVEARGHALPDSFDAADAEREAWRTLHTVRSLALVRALFRRALEAWIVVDKALWLAEQGRGVALGTFCPRTVTPRNLLILSLSPRCA